MYLIAQMMKTSPLYLRLFLALLAFSSSAIAQVAPMHYYFVLLVRPENAPSITQEAGEKIQEAHMANIRKLGSEHKLAIAGPFLEDSSLRGIFVFRAGSVAQVEEWTHTDPAIQAGRLSPEIHGPWLIDESALHDPGTTKGIEQYTLVFLKSTEKWNPKSPGFADAMNQHAAFMKQMTEQGKLAITGLFSSTATGDLCGVAIFRVGSEQTAKLIQSDPSVRAGQLKPEIHPWATGKGVLAAGQPMP